MVIRALLFVSLAGCSLFRSLAEVGADCDKAQAYFDAEVEPLLEAKCISCHSNNGPAAQTHFVLVRGDTTSNLAAFREVSTGEDALILQKPTGVIAHTGGPLAPPGSAEYATLSAMADTVNACVDSPAFNDTEAAAAPVDSHDESPLLRSSVRRLSVAEYEATLTALLGAPVSVSGTLANDIRQSGFTANLEQQVDGTTSDQLFSLAQAVADTAPATIVPCDRATVGCDRTFVKSFAEQGYRRPVSDEEVTDLLKVFHAAADGGGTFDEGVNAVVATVAQAASLLYISQIGTGTGTAATLELHEAASVLSYMTTGGPPDTALQAAVRDGSLATGEQRAAHARRLLRDGRQVTRFVREWLEIDRLEHVNRTGAVDFAAIEPAMARETESFVSYVTEHDGAALTTLLGADYSVLDADMASFYGVTSSGVDTPTSLASTPRRGLLGQAAFLATYAHETYSAPVKRGARVMSKLLCVDLPLPTGDVGKDAMAPLPTDPSLTTRERFATHSSKAACASCHDLIDGYGFAFESFDQMGAFRATEKGKPVDASGSFKSADVSGTYANAAELMAQLATSEQVAGCFRRYVARFVSTTTQSGFETSFEKLAAKETRLVELIVAYTQSDLFMTRSTQQ